MNPTTTALLQSALKILGTWVVAHAVMSQQDADQAITALQAVLGAVITLAGVTWHWRTAGGKGPPPAATGLIVILLMVTGCVSAGNEGVRLGIIGNGVGLGIRTPTATNSWVITPGINVTNLVDILIQE